MEKHVERHIQYAIVPRGKGLWEEVDVGVGREEGKRVQPTRRGAGKNFKGA